jgi:small nuclear ribonucleoprotein (snRNP)-like protein
MEALTQEVSSISLEDSEISWVKERVLGKKLKITLEDNRIVKGKLHCVDHQGNVILEETKERIPVHDLKRQLGNIIIPGRAIAKIEMKQI